MRMQLSSGCGAVWLRLFRADTFLNAIQVKGNVRKEERRPQQILTTQSDAIQL